jgi:hypothetical protein
VPCSVAGQAGEVLDSLPARLLALKESAIPQAKQLCSSEAANTVRRLPSWSRPPGQAPDGTIVVAREHTGIHEDGEGKEVSKAPDFAVVTHGSLRLQPMQMPLGHLQREMIYCTVYETKQALFANTQGPFHCSHQCPEKILSVLGSKAQKCEGY